MWGSGWCPLPRRLPYKVFPSDKSLFCVVLLKTIHEKLDFSQKIVKLAGLLDSLPFLHSGEKWVFHLCESVVDFTLIVWIKRVIGLELRKNLSI
jgi:hypothetical protein